MKRQTIFGLEKKRKQVIDMLSHALEHNDLDIHAYEKRIEIAIQAKSIEELEQSMTQRWGTSLEKWTSEDHFEDDDDDFVVVGETQTQFRATPVADPWSEEDNDNGW